MRWRLWPWRPVSDEGRRHLAAVRDQDAEVERVGAQLARIQQDNHFSEMVLGAITRATGGAHDG